MEQLQHAYEEHRLCVCDGVGSFLKDKGAVILVFGIRGMFACRWFFSIGPGLAAATYEPLLAS